MTSIAMNDDILLEKIPSFLHDLNAVAVALVTRNGVLKDANSGFIGMIPGENAATALLDVRHLFVNPRFDQFAARQSHPSDGSIYRGIFNIGEMNKHVRSLRGAIYAFGNNLLLIAEHDVEELEKNVAILQMLNSELAEAGREIARLERKLERKDDAARGALADREALLKVLSRNVPGSKRDDVATRPGFSNQATDPSSRFSIEWTGDLGTGVTELDCEHRDLISCFHRVANSLERERDIALFHSRFEELMNATAEHFAHEERVMKTIGFPSYAQHKREHDRLLNDSKDLLKNIGAALPLEDCPAIAHYLKHWLVRHMRERDSEIHTFITQ